MFNIKATNKSRKLNQGLTLPEIIMSLVLMCIIMLILTRAWYLYQRNLQNQLVAHQHEEAARKVYALIRDSVHMAGHVGCRTVSAEFLVKGYDGIEFNRKSSLQVSSNMLGVMNQYFPVATVIKPIRATSVLYVDTGAWFHSNQYLVIADCQHAEIFQVAGTTPEHGYQIVRSKRPLAYHYDVMAEVGRLDSREIYSKEDVIIHKRVSDKRLHYVKNVSGLVFVDDGYGVEFEFDTHVRENNKHWYGYASRW